MWRTVALGTVALLLFAQVGARSQSLDADTIAKVASTTRSLCLAGSQYDLQVNADGSLSLLKLEPGGQGKIRITQSTGAGGALNYQDEGKRVEADKNIIGCISQNLPTLLTAAGARLASPAPPKACRNPSHGVERFLREFDVTRDSGWRGGGYDQGRWCSDVIAILRGEFPAVGSTFDIVSHDEREESKCRPFNCPQYNYVCTVHVKTDPIYVESVGPECQ
jgi:hypothetical protein